MRVRRRTNALWGIVLLGVALVLLAQALGVIPAPVYDLLARAWPALLVLVGLSVLLRGRVPFASVIAIVVSVVLAVGIGAFAFTTRASQQRSDQVLDIQQDVTDGLGLLRVHISTLATDVEILRSADNAIRGQFVGATESRIDTSYEEGMDLAATYTLTEVRASSIPNLEALGRGTLRLELPGGVPLDVVLTSANGDVTLNMDGTALERMNVDLTNGDALVNLPSYRPLSASPDQSQGTLAVRNGNISVVVPADVAARLELERGGSGIEPEYDPSLYNFLFNTVLESRTIETAETIVQYEIVAPNGRIRLEVLGD